MPQLSNFSWNLTFFYVISFFFLSILMILNFVFFYSVSASSDHSLTYFDLFSY